MSKWNRRVLKLADKKAKNYPSKQTSKFFPPEFKATSHWTIFGIPIRPVREDQRHRRLFTR